MPHTITKTLVLLVASVAVCLPQDTQDAEEVNIVRISQRSLWGYSSDSFFVFYDIPFLSPRKRTRPLIGFSVNAAFEELRVRARAGSGRLPKLEILRAAIQHIERLQAALRAAAALENESCKGYMEPVGNRSPPARETNADREKPFVNNDESCGGLNSLARLKCIVLAIAKSSRESAGRHTTQKSVTEIIKESTDRGTSSKH